MAVVISSCQPIRVSSEARSFLTVLPNTWVYVHKGENRGELDTVTISKVPESDDEPNLNERIYRCQSHKWNTELVLITVGNEMTLYDKQVARPLLKLHFPLEKRTNKHVEEDVSVLTPAGSFNACTRISVGLDFKDSDQTTVWIDRHIGVIRVNWKRSIFYPRGCDMGVDFLFVRGLYIVKERAANCRPPNLFKKEKIPPQRWRVSHKALNNRADSSRGDSILKAEPQSVMFCKLIEWIAANKIENDPIE